MGEKWIPYKIIKDQVVSNSPIRSEDIIPELKEEDAAAGKEAFRMGMFWKLKEAEKVPSNAGS